MAIAIGTAVWGAASTTSGNYDTAITPAATPNGVCVIVQANSVTDLVTSVAYGIAGGAVSLTRASFQTDATEAGAIYVYWAGDSSTFPTSTQTVRVVRTGTANMRMVCWTMTVAGGKQVQMDGTVQTGSSVSVANPSWSHSSLVNDVVAFLGIHSGLNTMTTTPATNWTKAVGDTTSEDTTAVGRGWAQRTLATAGALAPGWTAATADDFVGSSVAFKEGDPPAAAEGFRRKRGPNYRR